MTPKQLDDKISIAELRAFYPALAAVAETGLREPLEPDDAAWLDGPTLARWLYRHGLSPRNKLGEIIARQVRRWAEGDAVNMATADKVLVGLGHHLNDLPDNAWRDRPNRKGMKAPEGLHRQAVREVRAGRTTQEVADRYGLHRRTVSRWVHDDREVREGQKAA